MTPEEQWLQHAAANNQTYTGGPVSIPSCWPVGEPLRLNPDDPRWTVVPPPLPTPEEAATTAGRDLINHPADLAKPQ